MLMRTLRSHDIVIFGEMNGKLLQKIYILKNAKKTGKPNNRDLNHDWISILLNTFYIFSKKILSISLDFHEQIYYSGNVCLKLR